MRTQKLRLPKVLHVATTTTIFGVQEKQIGLRNMPIKKTASFMRALFNSVKIKDITICFYTAYSTNSKGHRDLKMDSEKFINNFSKPNHVGLQTGSPNPDVINLHASYNDRNMTRSVLFTCPFTQENYDEVNKLYKEAYGCEI